MTKKKVLIGLLAAFSLSFVLAGCGNKSDSKENTESKTENSKKADSLLSKDKDFKAVLSDSDKGSVIKHKERFDTDWKDANWKGVNFNIDKVKIASVDKFKDDENKSYKEVISVHYNLRVDGDNKYTVKPKDATVKLANDENVKAKFFDDYWKDGFTKDSKKDGFVYFVVKEKKDISKAKEVAFEFTVKDESGKEETHLVKLPLKKVEKN